MDLAFTKSVLEALWRASAPDLDRIQQALELINVAPAQITIEVKLVEISQQDTGELGTTLSGRQTQITV